MRPVLEQVCAACEFRLVTGLTGDMKGGRWRKGPEIGFNGSQLSFAGFRTLHGYADRLGNLVGDRRCFPIPCPRCRMGDAQQGDHAFGSAVRFVTKVVIQPTVGMPIGVTTVAAKPPVAR